MAETFANTVSKTNRPLAKNAFLELDFDPGPGGGHVIVSAQVQDPDFIKLIDDPEPGVPDHEIQQASVKITVVSPSGVEVFSKDVPLPRPNIDSLPQAFPLAAPVEKPAGGVAGSGTPGPARSSSSRPNSYSASTPRI